MSAFDLSLHEKRLRDAEQAGIEREKREDLRELVRHVTNHSNGHEDCLEIMELCKRVEKAHRL